MTCRRHNVAPRVFALLAALLFSGGSGCALTAREVLVVYNSALPESAEIAQFYAAARDIPASQVVGYELPTSADISRAQYDRTLLAPLRETFESNGWWRRGRDANNLLLPVENKIRAIVLIRGVPLRIKAEPAGPAPATPPADPVAGRDEASVDSELALFGIEGLPVKGVLKNAFFQSKARLADSKHPYLVLTSRIDGPGTGVCKSIISDSIETEIHGLWGRAYVDIANKFPQGDQWLAAIAKRNHQAGIPTIVDRFNDTLPKNYPMTEAALYYGWYDWNVSGPFLNPAFRFRKGAVAVHLHSFSAQQITDPTKNWVAPLLDRGAAATLGNVHEPYLHLSHYFDTFHDRLLEGWTLAEAAWAAIPVASWQAVVIGDPLYRPFLHFGGTGEQREQDREFRALRAAARQWENPAERRAKLAAAANKLSSGSLAEGLALDYREAGDTTGARQWFQTAKGFFPNTEDKLRQDLQIIAIDREQNNKQAAINELRTAQARYGPIPAAGSLAAWLDILDPPPPPQADPTKLPAR